MNYEKLQKNKSNGHSHVEHFCWEVDSLGEVDEELVVEALHPVRVTILMHTWNEHPRPFHENTYPTERFCMLVDV